jgi:hypothetical protein
MFVVRLYTENYMNFENNTFWEFIELDDAIKFGSANEGFFSVFDTESGRLIDWEEIQYSE